MDSRSGQRWGSRCRVATTLAVAVALLIVGPSGAMAAQPGKEGNHCISPEGVDLNARYGISAQIVAFFCPQVGAGEQWTVPQAWFMSPTFDAVPEGFVPAGATPLADFVAKFIGVRYVVDPGTAQEQTFAFPNGGTLWTGSVDGFVLVNPLTLGTLHPLPVGEHLVEVYWAFSAMHCDGLAAVIEENCLPAGEFLFRLVAFEVTPGHYE